MKMRSKSDALAGIKKALRERKSGKRKSAEIKFIWGKRRPCVCVCENEEKPTKKKKLQEKIRLVRGMQDEERARGAASEDLFQQVWGMRKSKAKTEIAFHKYVVEGGREEACGKANRKEITQFNSMWIIY